MRSPGMKQLPHPMRYLKQRMIQHTDDLVTGLKGLLVPLNIVAMDGFLGFLYLTSKFVPW